MYEVIHFFTDLQDFDHPYHVGEIFPRDGLKVTSDRLEELSTNKNRQGKALIRIMKDKSIQYSKSEINRMPVAELKELAKLEGIVEYENKTGADLKKLLIKMNVLSPIEKKSIKKNDIYDLGFEQLMLDI